MSQAGKAPASAHAEAGAFQLPPSSIRESGPPGAVMGKTFSSGPMMHSMTVGLRQLSRYSAAQGGQRFSHYRAPNSFRQKKSVLYYNMDFDKKGVVE